METSSPESTPRSSTWWAALALIAIAAFFLRDGLFGGRVLLPFDALEQFEPWKSAVPTNSPPKNPLLLDQVIVIAPWMKFASERLHAGELPLWNSLNYAGQPIGGAYQLGLYWPLNWIYFASPSWTFFAWSAFAKLALSGLFMLLFLRSLSVRPGAAAVGALAFMLCGFEVAWLGHNQTNVALFAPLLLWLVERVAARPSARNLAFFALAVGLQFCAGHAQTSAHLTLVVASYAVFRALVEVDGTRVALGKLVLASLLGALLAAPQLLPFFEYLRDSQGLVSNARADLVTRDGAWKGLAMLLQPNVFGSPVTHDYSGPSGDHLNFSELIGARVGCIALAFALAGLLIGREKRRWFFAGLLAIALCAAFQLAPIYDALRSIPLLAATKWMRFSLFAAFAFATLAAFGIDAVLARFGWKGRPGAIAIAGVFALVAVELVVTNRDFNPTVDPSLAAPRTPLTDFLIAKTASEPPFRVLALDDHALIANANLYYDIPLLTGYDSMELSRTTDLIRRLSSDPRGEVFAQEIRWFDKNLPLGSLLGVRYLLSSKPLGAPFELVLDGPCKIYENPSAMPEVFAATKTVLETDPAKQIEALARPDFDPHVAIVEREAPSELAKSVGAAVGPTSIAFGTLGDHEDRTIAFDATIAKSTLVVVASAWAPGWRATANGVPIEIERVDHALCGVWLDRGRWKVELRYEPASTRIGLWIGGAALVMLIALFARKDRRP